MIKKDYLEEVVEASLEVVGETWDLKLEEPATDLEEIQLLTALREKLFERICEAARRIGWKDAITTTPRHLNELANPFPEDSFESDHYEIGYEWGMDELEEPTYEVS